MEKPVVRTSRAHPPELLARVEIEYATRARAGTLQDFARELGLSYGALRQLGWRARLTSPGHPWSRRADGWQPAELATLQTVLDTAPGWRIAKGVLPRLAIELGRSVAAIKIQLHRMRETKATNPPG